MEQSASKLRELAVFVPGPSCARSRPTEQLEHRSHILERFTVANDGDLLLVPVTFDGTEHLFAIDTASNLTVFDNCFNLGRPIRQAVVATPSGKEIVSLFHSPIASVGTLSLNTGSLVQQMDLTLLRHVSGQEIRGIVGMDFLARYVLHINFDSGNMLFLRSVTNDLGRPVRILWEHGLPCVEVGINGLASPPTFVIDTASIFAGNVKRHLLTQLAQQGKAKRLGSSLTAGVGGTKVHDKWVVESVTLDGCEHRNIVVTEREDNILGLRFWREYVLTFDFQHDVLHVNKGCTVRNDSDIDASGLHILRVNNKVVVHSVDEGSAAAISGIEANDVIVSVGSDNVASLSMLSLRRRFATAGETVRVTISRNERVTQQAISL